MREREKRPTRSTRVGASTKGMMERECWGSSSSSVIDENPLVILRKSWASKADQESGLLSAWHEYASHDSPCMRSERVISGNQMRYAPHYLRGVHKSTTR
jgi:hypothetical protein